MPANRHLTSVRELELARSLHRLLEILPFGTVLTLVRHLVGHWKNPDGNSSQQVEQEYGIRCEVPVSGIDTARDGRLDVVVPLRSPRVSDSPVGSTLFDGDICFELKIGEENLDQVENYAKARNESLIVSIARTLKRQQPTHANIVRITWTEWFWWLFPLLGRDAQLRLTKGVEAPVKIESPFQDILRPLDLMTAAYLEDFLRDLRQRGLVRLHTNRVIVVTGETATRSTDGREERYMGRNVYYFPRRWDDEFNIVCVVWGSTLQFAGRVISKYIWLDQEVVQIEGEPGADPPQEFSEGDFFVYLDPLPEPIFEQLRLRDRFAGKGPFTQSHRYFNQPQDFVRAFTMTDSISLDTQS